MYKEPWTGVRGDCASRKTKGLQPWWSMIYISSCGRRVEVFELWIFSPIINYPTQIIKILWKIYICEMWIYIYNPIPKLTSTDSVTNFEVLHWIAHNSNILITLLQTTNTVIPNWYSKSHMTKKPSWFVRVNINLIVNLQLGRATEEEHVEIQLMDIFCEKIS